MKGSNWTPAFAGETNIRKAWFFVVIPAEAGIQDDLKKDEIHVQTIMASLVSRKRADLSYVGSRWQQTNDHIF